MTLKFSKFFIVLLAIFFIWPNFVKAQNVVELYFFYSDSCPHCAKEELWLDKLEQKYSKTLIIQRYEVSNKESVSLLEQKAKQLGVQVNGVPFTVVGEQYFIGYGSDETTGEKIEMAILAESKPIDFGAPSFQAPGNPNLTQDEIVATSSQKIVEADVSNIAGFNLQGLSLPLITVVLGILDGFNPCAMWTLIFLISLLLGMKDKKRMWILGATFIFVSGLIYYLFMAAWLNVILFLGFITGVRLLIAVIALVGGLYHLYSYFTNKAGECKVGDADKKKKVFSKLEEITGRQSFLWAMIGITLLAIAVNMIELICSAGLPMVYAQVLAMNDLAPWQHYVYIALYILFFMLDDIIVFVIAMVTLQLTGLGGKYSRWSNFIGGILMVLIGLALFFKPELLMFG